MLLQLLSDLHLETFPSHISYHHTLTDASYLALLGDICHVANPVFEKLITQVLDHYSIVFYLLGNHDPKGLSMSAAKARIRTFEKRMNAQTNQRTIGRFVFLDQTRYDIDGFVTVLGCTLYSHVLDEHKPLVERGMVEFHDTVGWTVDQHNDAHASDVAWLNAQVMQIEENEPQRSVFIFSHHCPTTNPRASDLKHHGSAVSCAFSSDLSGQRCWTSGSVSFWAWGHTHWNCEFQVEREERRALKCFTNQKGYYKAPKKTFDAKVLVDLTNGRVYHGVEDGSPEEDTAIGSDGEPREGKSTMRSLGRLKSIFRKHK